jgi:hypothetical protein
VEKDGDGAGTVGAVAAHLEEAIGVEDAAAVVDPSLVVDWHNLATRDGHRHLERKLDELESRMDRLESRMDRLDARVDAGFTELRRDLLKVTGAQYFAPVAVVAAVLGSG